MDCIHKIMQSYEHIIFSQVNRIVDCKAPIHYAAQAGSVAVVKALLEFQADVNILVFKPQ